MLEELCADNENRTYPKINLNWLPYINETSKVYIDIVLVSNSEVNHSDKDAIEFRIGSFILTFF